MAGRLAGRRLAFLAGMLSRRIALLVALFALTYFAVAVLPGDAAVATLGTQASPAEIAAVRARLGLDQPPLQRFLGWFGNLLRGDLGTSVTGQPVAEVIGQNFPNTLVVGGLALLVTVLVALAIGGYSTVRPGSRADRFLSSFSVGLLALPEFVVANALVLVFALWLNLFPAVTVTSTDGVPASPVMYVLPVLALALRQIGWNARIVRTALADQLPTPHVDSAVLDGLPRRRVLTHYLLPGAAPTIAAGIATSAGMVLGGVVTVETLFNFPGMGAILVEAIHNRDAPLVADVVALTGLVITVLLVGADLLRLWIVGSRR